MEKHKKNYDGKDIPKPERHELQPFKCNTCGGAVCCHPNCEISGIDFYANGEIDCFKCHIEKINKKS